jgi:pimeloyl-ACP methyl ester carboxylesterase
MIEAAGQNGSQGTTSGGVTPFYFGEAEALFGLYHSPLSRADRETGVVFCNPFGREELYAHRALRHLALRLAEGGFHVLRFDYYGSGDSAGDSDETTLGRWTHDVGEAIDELKSRAGLVQAALIGLRLGAAAAWLAAEKRPDVEAIALWEPALSGREYLDEIVAHDRDWRAERKVPQEARPGSEVLGFPINEALRQELNDLEHSPEAGTCPSRHALVLRHHPPGKEPQSTPSAPASNARFESARVPGHAFWRRDNEGPTIVVPGPSVQKIVEWADRVLS